MPLLPLLYLGSEQLYEQVSALCTNLEERQSRMQELESFLPADVPQADIEQRSLEAACTAAIERLQEQIEMAYFHIQKKHSCIQNVAGA